MATDKPRKLTPMDVAHVMDFGPLDLGHPPVSKRVVNIVETNVNVFGLKEIEQSSLPICVIMLAHGWANKASQMEHMAYGILGEINRHEKESGRQRAKDVLIVTVDQRNHGTRRIKGGDGLAFDNNPRRLLQMSATVTGGKQDHEYIMDFLPDYLYPNEEREVVQWMSSGVSLGGHVSWRLLREDPRIKIAVPIVSVPPEVLGDLILAKSRGGNYGPTMHTHTPPTVRKFFWPPPKPGAFRGKKILALHGEVDRVLPHTPGSWRWDEIRAEAERPEHMVKLVQPERGHVVTPEMVLLAAEWFWRWGVSVDDI